MSELSPISQYLCDQVDATANNLDMLANALEPASALIVETLLNDRKLIVCGNGYSAPMATLLTTCLMHQLEFERPSLPALNISIDSTTISAIAKDSNYHKVYAKQIRALAQDGDTLIALSLDGNCSNIVQAIQTAHEKDIKVLAITGFADGNISAVLNKQDVEVQLMAESVPTAMQLQLMAINAVCHEVENNLFGGFN